MARYSDIRMYLGTVDPSITFSQCSHLLKMIVLSVSGDGAGKVLHNDKSYAVTKLDSNRISIGDNTHIYLLPDVKMAINEFDLLTQQFGPETPYTHIFFEDESYPDDLEFTDASRALLNSKLYAAVMKRAYNWFRSGSDNPIYVNHANNGKLIATVVVTNVRFMDGCPIVHFNIIKKEVVILSNTVIINIPVKDGKTVERFAKRSAHTDTVRTLIQDITNLGYNERAFEIVNKLSTALTHYQDRSENLRVILKTRYMDWMDTSIIAQVNYEGQPGITFLHSLGTPESCINLTIKNPISISELAAAMTIIKNEDVVGDKQTVVEPLTENVFKGYFLKDTPFYQDIYNALSENTKRGETAYTRINRLGIKLQYHSSHNDRPCYAMECALDETIYIFDMHFDIKNILDSARNENSPNDLIEIQSTQPKKLWGTGKIKQFVSGLFA